MNILPLFKSPKDWAIFKARCNKDWDVALLNNISDTIKQLSFSANYDNEGERLKNVLKDIIINAVEQVNEDGCSGTQYIRNS